MDKGIERVKAFLRARLDVQVTPTRETDRAYHEGVSQGLRIALSFCEELGASLPTLSEDTVDEMIDYLQRLR